jgi:hypothetical protein
MPKRLTKDIFISRAKKMHGRKYNYSKVNLVNSITKVEIICPTHGSFFQLMYDHMCGRGCPDCGVKARSLSHKNFVSRSKKIHKNVYDYSKVNYVNTRTKVEIICSIHGSFFQRPDSHLKGARCAECVYDAHRANGSIVRSAIVLY